MAVGNLLPGRLRLATGLCPRGATRVSAYAPGLLRNGFGRGNRGHGSFRSQQTLDGPTPRLFLVLSTWPIGTLPLRHVRYHSWAFLPGNRLSRFSISFPSSVLASHPKQGLGNLHDGVLQFRGPNQVRSQRRLPLRTVVAAVRDQRKDGQHLELRPGERQLQSHRDKLSTSPDVCGCNCHTLARDQENAGKLTEGTLARLRGRLIVSGTPPIGTNSRSTSSSAAV